MKQGVRALGVAESYRGEGGDSYLAGAVVRASGTVDGLEFTTTTVGGTDATEAVVRLYDSTDREDVRLLMLSGVALSWYNIVDLCAVHEATEVPVVSVTYEGSEGLQDSIRDEFDGDARDERLAVYDSLPERRCVTVDGTDLYVRSIGASEDRSDDWIRGFTLTGGRPEPVRVARLAARGLLAYEEGMPEEDEERA
ncbi:MAG: DUF99 family protein [Halobacteria archaeon]